MKEELGWHCVFKLFHPKIENLYLFILKMVSDMLWYEKPPDPKFRFSLSMDLFQKCLQDPQQYVSLVFRTR